MSQFEQARIEIEAALRRGEPYDAMDRLAVAFETPAVLRDDDERRAAFRLLAAAADEVVGGDVCEPARALADSPCDGDALYRLGYQLLERRLYAMGRAVLRYAVRSLPTRADLLAELVAAYELVGDNASAVAILDTAPTSISGTPICRALLAFNALMMGDLERPRKLAAALPASDEVIGHMRRRLELMLRRADAIRAVSALDSRDARGWNYVLTGGLLLHPVEGTRGHYGELADSYDLLVMGIARLRAVFDAWRWRPEKVLALPDPDSFTIASCTAAALGVRCVPWSRSDRVGLTVAYDLANALPEIAGELGARTPGQLLFGHVASRASEQRLTADFVTALYTTSRAPWDEDSDDRAFGVRVAGSGPGADLASVLGMITARLLVRDPERDDDLVAFASAVRPDDFCTGLRHTGSRRERRWMGSPVRLDHK